jgi:hypothetical protein
MSCFRRAQNSQVSASLCSAVMKVFALFPLLLHSLIERCTLENKTFLNDEVTIESLQDSVVDLGVIVKQLKTDENIFNCFSYAVDEHGNLALLKLAVARSEAAQKR